MHFKFKELSQQTPTCSTVLGKDSIFVFDYEPIFISLQCDMSFRKYE